MANQLSVPKVHSILTLHERGCSQRQIARHLGVNRETVARYIRTASKPATLAHAPPGSAMLPPPLSCSSSLPPMHDDRALTGCEDPLDGHMAAVGTDASVAGGAAPGRAGAGPGGEPPVPAARTSHSVAYRDVILAKLAQGLSAVRIHQDLREVHGASTPSYHSVRRYVAKLHGQSPAPFRRMEVAPGEQAQVDFGKGAMLIDAQGKRRRPHVLRVVLSHSRAGYSEAVLHQTTESFIRCIENAFHHFGGVPQTLVLDNLRAAVSKADWFDPELNPKVQSFFAHYGVAALPTKPRMPRHKGKVERGVGYVQDNGCKGHTFTSLVEHNTHLRHWESHVADTRIHGTTQKQVRALFEQVEKPALHRLPATRFACFEEVRRKVHRDGHVAVAKAYYSVPPQYMGRQVWVRYDSRLVRIFDGRMTLIATHIRREPGQFSTQDHHILDRKIAAVERGAAWLLDRLGIIGPQARRWGEAMVCERGIQGVRVLQGLLALAHRQPIPQIEQACELALDHRCFRLRTIRQLVSRNLEHAPRQQILPELIEEHPIIRSLEDYGRFVHDALLQPTMETPR